MPRGEGTSWPAVVLVAALLLIVLDVWWLLTYRQGQPLDVDEAGYMLIALNDHAGLSSSGLSAYWNMIESQTPQAPLIPAITALVYVLHEGILSSYSVVLAFVVVLGTATYAVGTRLAGPRLAAVAALVTLTAPGTIAYSREYTFALPAAALVTCSLYALLRSDGLRSRRWAVALGVVVAAALLTRTMTVAFVPALVVGALLRIATLQGGRQRALLNLAASLTLAAALSAIWYAPNLSSVYHYLVDFGYGHTAGQYGTSHPITSLSWWTTELNTLAQEDLYLPLTVTLLVGLVAGAVMTAHRLRAATDRRTALAGVARSDALTVAIVLVGAYLALSSSTNRGSGFALVLVAPVAALAVMPLRRSRALQAPVFALLATIALVNLLASTELWSGLSDPRQVDIPVLGSVPLVGPQANAVTFLRVELPGNPTRFEAPERAWPRIDRTVADFLIAFAHAHGREPIVAFGARNRVFNTNTVGLAARLYDDTAIPMAQLDPTLAGDRSSAYAAYLDAPEHGQPNLLVTVNRDTGDFAPAISPTQATAAARADGFTRVDKVRLPDGRVASIWWLPRGPVA